LYERCCAFIQDRGARGLKFDRGPAATRKPGEDWTEAVARVRAELEALRAEHRRIEAAPLTLEERYRNAENLVAPYIGAGVIDTDGLCFPVPRFEFARNFEPVSWPTRRSPHIVGATFIDPVALICAVAPDLVVAKLKAEIDATSDDLEESIAEADRPKLLA